MTFSVAFYNVGIQTGALVSQQTGSFTKKHERLLDSLEADVKELLAKVHVVVLVEIGNFSPLLPRSAASKVLTSLQRAAALGHAQVLAPYAVVAQRRVHLTDLGLETICRQWHTGLYFRAQVDGEQECHVLGVHTPRGCGSSLKHEESVERSLSVVRTRSLGGDWLLGGDLNLSPKQLAAATDLHHVRIIERATQKRHGDAVLVPLQSTAELIHAVDIGKDFARAARGLDKPLPPVSDAHNAVAVQVRASATRVARRLGTPLPPVSEAHTAVSPAPAETPAMWPPAPPAPGPSVAGDWQCFTDGTGRWYWNAETEEALIPHQTVVDKLGRSIMGSWRREVADLGGIWKHCTLPRKYFWEHEVRSGIL